MINRFSSLMAGGPSALNMLGLHPDLRMIGQRTGQNGQQAQLTTNWSLNSYSKHLLPNGANAIQLIYAGWYMNSSGVELIQPIGLYVATGVTVSGGTGYAKGDVDTFAITTSTGITAVKVLHQDVAAGVPNKVKVIDGGAMKTILANGVSAASTSGSGTGATYTFTWDTVPIAGKVGIEPVHGQQVFTGANAVKAAYKGIGYDMRLNNTLLVPHGDFFMTELIPCDVPVGGYIGLRATLASQAFMGRIPQVTAYGSASNIEEAYSNTTWFDESLSGTINPGASVTLIQPIAIMGIPKQQSPTIMAAFADSRCVGITSGPGAVSSVNDPLDVDGNIGWLEKALSTVRGKCVYPYSNCSRGGDQYVSAIPASNAALGGRAGRLKAIALLRPTAVYINACTNGFAAGKTLQNTIDYEAQLVKEIKGLGVKYVFTDTVDPRASSSDQFATTVNQTRATGHAVATARNTGLRDGTYLAATGIDGFIDQSPNVESAIDSGYWKVDGSAKAGFDGVHAYPAMIEAKADTAAAWIAANISL